jgi:uncharacterized phage protein (TIGR01671 family)
MRDIKFRLWDLQKKVLRSPETLEEMVFEGGVLSLGEYFEVMQYTGLKDKNGNEIYEGDIVETSTVNGFDSDGKIVSSLSQVKFGILNEPGGYEDDGEVWNGFYIEHIGIMRDGVRDKDYGKPAFKFALVEGNMRVVGNIYENPELL